PSAPADATGNQPSASLTSQPCVQDLSQGIVHEVRPGMGVDGGRRPPGVADLPLDEERISAVLDQMSDVGVPQAVRMQHLLQPERVPVLGEPSGDVPSCDPPPAL